jgi:prepilin-type N-terminal cleavage/methylation domain-containing protein
MSRLSRRGFTLVEMLIVLAIIGVLIGLLLPAVMAAVNYARRTAIATEIGELDKAVTAYKDKTGDFPPNFRDFDAFMRHVRKCYPKADAAHLTNVTLRIWSLPPNYTAMDLDTTRVPNIDEGEALVLWLYLLDNDPREPFKAILAAFNAAGSVDATLLAAGSPERHFPFKEERLIDGGDADFLPSYKAAYSGETFYLYLDSRSYDELIADFTSTARGAFGEDPSFGNTRPYWSETRASTNTTLPLWRQFKPMNPTSFQIISAGQDEEFGVDLPPVAAPERPIKFFPGGGGPYQDGDQDNITNFTAGRRLEDHIP